MKFSYSFAQKSIRYEKKGGSYMSVVHIHTAEEFQNGTYTVKVSKDGYRTETVERKESRKGAPTRRQ